MIYINPLIIDIGLVALFLMPVVDGYKRGGVASILSIARTFLCLLCAFIAAPFIKDFLVKHTTIHKIIIGRIDSILQSSLNGEYFYSLLPYGAESSEHGSVIPGNSLSGLICNIILSILSFILIFAILKIVLFILIKYFSQKKDGILLRKADRIIGVLIGAVEGSILVCFVLLLAIPLLSLTEPESAKPVAAAIQNSEMCDLFYYNNPILKFIY